MAKWLVIRLTRIESDNLTKIRSSVEREGRRITVKKILNELIIEAAVKKEKLGVNLPIFKTTPEIINKDIFEQISIFKSEEENKALKYLEINSDGMVLNYGQADIIRELIKIKIIDLENGT